ncbi:hypothetical protein PRUPE_4G229400 [Prunus persica]|uniref:Uncharacterized protein n=1 Tax=Prunus persica TaxID=3760 RepID=A0A251PPR6_PRUPE|nr:hypothetical protein PRUPE_4G229400 [Prunus persica]
MFSMIMLNRILCNGYSSLVVTKEIHCGYFSRPLFLTLFPKIILHRCQPLATTATYTRDSLQCAQPHTNSDSKLAFVLVTMWSTSPQPLLICCLYVRYENFSKYFELRVWNHGNVKIYPFFFFFNYYEDFLCLRCLVVFCN